MKIEEAMAAVDQGLAKMMKATRNFHCIGMAAARRETRTASVDLALAAHDNACPYCGSSAEPEQPCEKRAEIEVLKEVANGKPSR